MTLAHSNWFESNPKKTIIGALIVIIIGLDFFVANVFKRLTGYPWKSYGQQKIEKLYRIPSDNYHHDLLKNKAVDNVPWGHLSYNVRTNSLGFKDFSVRDIPLVPEGRRIVFMGDSFTEGVGVDYKDSFVGLIASALSADKIDVLNAGVVGYSPIIYWRKTLYLIEEIGLKFDELIVFLDISDPTNEVVSYRLDERGNVAERSPFSQEEKNFKTFLRDNTILLYSLSNWIHDTLFPGRSVYAINLKLSRWTVDRELYEEIWWYHEEHPRVTYYRIMKQFGINIDKADKILEDVKRKKRQGWVSPFEKPPEQH